MRSPINLRRFQGNRSMNDPRLPRIRCRHCGDERPFETIEVRKVPLLINGQNCGEQNFQFCSDRPECIEAAADFTGYLKDQP